jgi:hypothetical protein
MLLFYDNRLFFTPEFHQKRGIKKAEENLHNSNESDRCAILKKSPPLRVVFF